jgi:LCP family protein required for cell wall assembly
LFYKGRKINEIYSQYGVEKLNEAVADITGINSQKYAIFDFNAFVDVIDGIGGIDINVEHDLKDNQYPGPGFSYTLVSFKKGLQHMNGSTALKFVRSRESTTDFDRSARQQLVISAIKQKLNTLDLLSSLPTFISLYEKIMSQIKTDVGIFEAFAYYDAYKSYEVKTGNILSSSNYLYSKISTKGQYILLPNGGNYSKIKKYVLGLVNG